MRQMTTMQPSDFLKSSKAYLTLWKINKGIWRPCKPYFVTKMLTAILLMLRWPKPIYMRVGYVFDLHFSE